MVQIPSVTGRLCDLGQVTSPLQASKEQEERSLPPRQTGRLNEITLDSREPGTQKTFTEHHLCTQNMLWTQKETAQSRGPGALGLPGLKSYAAEIWAGGGA